MNTELSVGMRCVKCLLFLLSFIFLCIGVFVVALGGALLISYYEFEEFLLPRYLKPVEVLIGVGAITVLVSFLGCLGGIKGSTVLVNIYALLLFLLLLLETAVLIAAVTLNKSIDEDIKHNMNEALQRYTREDNARRTWDVTQEMIKCCGVNSPIDWYFQHVKGPFIHFDGLSFTVPYSCCNGISCTKIYPKGCWTKMDIYLDHASRLVIYSTAVIVLAKLLAVVLAYNLAKAIRWNKSKALVRNYEHAIMNYSEPIIPTNEYRRF